MGPGRGREIRTAHVMLAGAGEPPFRVDNVDGWEASPASLFTLRVGFEFGGHKINCGFSHPSAWITRNGENLLWLPCMSMLASNAQ